jgi:hypothetical protein
MSDIFYMSVNRAVTTSQILPETAWPSPERGGTEPAEGDMCV